MDFLDITFFTILFIAIGMYTGKKQHEESLKNKESSIHSASAA